MSVPGVPTQLVAGLGAVAAWVNPTGALPHGLTQGVVIAGLSLVVAIIHAVQAYHRVNATPASPSTPTPTPAARIGA